MERQRSDFLAAHDNQASVRWAESMAKWKFPRRRCSGVYAIHNTFTRKAYIGSSVDIRQRWYDHLSHLRLGGATPKLQAAWNKYGPTVFRFCVLEYVEPEKDALLAAEQRLIDRWKAATRSGYNARSLANSMLGFRFSAVSRERCRIASTGRKIPNKAPQSNETKALRRTWWLSPAGQAEKDRLRLRNHRRRGSKWTPKQAAVWTLEKRAASGKKIGDRHRGRPWTEKRRQAEAELKASMSESAWRALRKKKGRPGVAWSAARRAADKRPGVCHG